jgi:hypothetical protein
MLVFLCQLKTKFVFRRDSYLVNFGPFYLVNFGPFYWLMQFMVWLANWLVWKKLSWSKTTVRKWFNIKTNAKDFQSDHGVEQGMMSITEKKQDAHFRYFQALGVWFVNWNFLFALWCAYLYIGVQWCLFEIRKNGRKELSSTLGRYLSLHWREYKVLWKIWISSISW